MYFEGKRTRTGVAYSQMFDFFLRFLIEMKSGSQLEGFGKGQPKWKEQDNEIKGDAEGNSGKKKTGEEEREVRKERNEQTERKKV